MTREVNAVLNENVNDVKDKENVEQQHEETIEQETETIEETINAEEDIEIEDVEDNKTSDTIQQLENEKEELKTRLLRLQADYDNFRRRTREESTAAAKYRSQNLAERLLPVIDNFERALDVETASEETKSVLQGIEMLQRQLKDALQKENIEEIEALGQLFDPECHQAVMQVDHEDYDSNTVVEVLQKGYKLNDRVIRPAMVKVNN
jgi:molecular chaperone GrpE